MKMEIQENINIKIDNKIHETFMAIKEKNDGNEFGAFLFAAEDDLYHITHIVIPEQTVSAGGMHYNGETYQNTVDKYMTEKILKDGKRMLCVGTFHVHPISGFSPTDEGDVKNMFGCNTSHGLPFVDIVYTSKNEYEARVILKQMVGKNKQFIKIDGEVDIFENDVEKITIIDQVKRFLSNFGGWKINDKAMNKLITKGVTEDEIKTLMKNIKKQVYERYPNNGYYGYGYERDDFGGHCYGGNYRNPQKSYSYPPTLNDGRLSVQFDIKNLGQEQQYIIQGFNDQKCKFYDFLYAELSESKLFEIKGPIVYVAEGRWELPVVIDSILAKRMKKDSRKKIRKFVELKLDQFQRLEEVYDDENGAIEDVIEDVIEKEAMQEYVSDETKEHSVPRICNDGQYERGNYRSDYIY